MALNVKVCDLERDILPFSIAEMSYSMKQVHPDLPVKHKINFSNTIGILGKLKHKNIVPVHWFTVNPLGAIFERYSFDIQPYISIKTTDDNLTKESITNLKTFLQLADKYKLTETLISGIDAFRCIAFDVASGLSYLHHKKITHRNLNTENILISDRLPPITAIISDFSDAEEYRTQSISSVSSRTNYGDDSVPFQSPEMMVSPKIRFTKVELYRADVWSYGCVLFCLLNPDLTYPYDVEFNDAQDVVRLRDLIQDKFTKQVRPNPSEKSVHLTKSMPVVYFISQMCMNFEPKWRPDMCSIAR